MVFFVFFFFSFVPSFHTLLTGGFGPVQGQAFFETCNELSDLALRYDTTDGWTGLYEYFFYDDGRLHI
jgi:hypothetical protein